MSSFWMGVVGRESLIDQIEAEEAAAYDNKTLAAAFWSRKEISL